MRNNDEKLVIIQHYETDIFIYDPAKNEAKVFLDCSRTSNKMIQRALDFFKPEKVIKTNAEKWSYSN